MSDETHEVTGVRAVSPFPPAWFVANFNREPTSAGLPYRGATDPLVMHAWAIATAPVVAPLCLLSGL